MPLETKMSNFRLNGGEPADVSVLSSDGCLIAPTTPLMVTFSTLALPPPKRSVRPTTSIRAE